MKFHQRFWSLLVCSLLVSAFVHAGQITLQWNAPTTNADGSVPLNDLSYYKVYWGTTSGVWSFSSQNFSPSLLEQTITSNNLVPGTAYFFMVKAGDTSSNESGASNVINATIPVAAVVATPTISPSGGSFTTSVQVTLNCVTSGATIRYTTNGSNPTASSTAYASPLTLTQSTTIRARAFKSGSTDSGTATAGFVINGVPLPPQATPTFVNTFNPARGQSLGIPFTLAGSGHVKVTVYDRKGHEIKVLMDEETTSGTAPWDGKNTDGDTVASGVYHVVIDAAGNKTTEKVVVVK